MKITAVALLLIAAAGIVAEPAQTPSAPRPRLIVFISDLHFGLGKLADGVTWNPREDFRWTSALGSFLDTIGAEGKDRVDLVIAGDLLELWQPPPGMDCGKNPDLGCTVEQMQELTRIVVKAHARDLALLGAFADRGDNCLHVIPGNHDAALLLDSIWHLVLPALGAKEDRVRRVGSGVWSSSDGKVVAEHGHQIWPDVNRFDGWPTVTSRGRMVRTWGENFVQSIFNTEEDVYPVIDNLVPGSAGVKYRMRDRGIFGTAGDLLRFLSFSVFETSGAQMRRSLGPTQRTSGGEAVWDLQVGRSLGAKLLLQGLPPDDPLRATAALGNDTGALDAMVGDPEAISDDMVKMLCDQLARRATEDATVPLCSKSKLNYVLNKIGIIPRSRVMRRHLAARLDQHPHMEMFVYGHTHALETPWSLLLKPLKSVTIVNTGAFQRLIDDGQFRRAAKGKPVEALRSLSLDDLTSCYSAVVVTYEGGAPRADLRNWHEDSAGRGTFLRPCDQTCARIASSCS